MIPLIGSPRAFVIPFRVDDRIEIRSYGLLPTGADGRPIRPSSYVSPPREEEPQLLKVVESAGAHASIAHAMIERTFARRRARGQDVIGWRKWMESGCTVR